MEEKEEEKKQIEEIIETKTINNEVIPINKYYKHEKIGKGAFGECFIFESQNDKAKYAGKIINKSKLKNTNSNQKNIGITTKNEENIRTEIAIQKSLDSPKIVKVKSYFENDQNIYIVLELCRNRSLKKLIEERGHLTEFEVKCYIFQLIQGLKILHSNKIIHRDLKPDNLLLDEKLELKIGDFGLVAKLSKNDEKRKTKCGTVSYMAPELIEINEKGYSFEVDIWAVGVIMFNLLTGKLPFSGDKIEQKILNCNYCFPEEIKISKAAKNLIEQILVKKPRKRPNLNQILCHDFFHNGYFPEFLNISTLKYTPSSEEIEKYMPESIINKEVINVELYQLPVPDFTSIKYNNIDEYVYKKITDNNLFIDFVTYFHKSSHFNLYYYELNNGLIGVIFIEDGIHLILNKKDKLLYNIIKIDDNNEKIEKYNIDEYPENLKNKYEIFIKYYENVRKHINKESNTDSSIINQNTLSKENISESSKTNTENESSIIKQEEIDDEEIDINLFYVKDCREENKAYFLQLSDDTKQIIFLDKSEILIHDKKDKILYIDKNRNKIFVSIFDIFNNSSNELKYRLKYIKKTTTKILKEKIKEKIKNHK